MYASRAIVVFIMERRVLKILTLFIIIKQCFGAMDIDKQFRAADEPSTRIQSCLTNIIEHIWDPSESLVFTISSQPDYLPVRLPNPVTVVDIRKPFPKNYRRYEVNYVMEAVSGPLLALTLSRLRNYSLWHNMESPKGKFVILTKEAQLARLFRMMWQQISALHVLVVMYDDTSQNYPMQIITSNPHTQENGCATKPTVFSKHTCNNISINFLKPIRDYHRCPVIISPHYPSTHIDLTVMSDVVMWNILIHLDLILNVTISYEIINNENQFIKMSYQHDIVVANSYLGKVPQSDNSIIFLRRGFVWMGPSPKEMSRMNVLFRPFNYDMWLAVLFITIFIIFLRWLIIRSTGYNNNHWNNLASAFTDIMSLTFGVGINRIPNIVSLKIVILFYLIYVIHIHTAYTSDLINVLVVPRYTGVISSVEEVVESGLPVYVSDIFIVNYFFDYAHNASLLSKISKLVRPWFAENSSVDHTKAFTVFVEDSFSLDGNNNKNSMKMIGEYMNIFLSNSLSGDVKSVFILKNGSYFVESLNSIITFLYESGIYSANFPVQYNKRYTTQREGYGHKPIFNEHLVPQLLIQSNKHRFKNWQEPLSLEHLSAIFVIFIVCLVFSTCVFIAEICIHKITRKCTRKSVVT